MAAISHVCTLRRAARIPDRDGVLRDQFEPEDGVLWIHDIDDADILAFTNDRGAASHLQGRVSPLW